MLSGPIQRLSVIQRSNQYKLKRTVFNLTYYLIITQFFLWIFICILTFNYPASQKKKFTLKWIIYEIMLNYISKNFGDC